MRITQRKGDIATSRALATFTAAGWDVSIPFTESAAYDLIVDAEGSLYRVQVKYCGTQDGEVDLRGAHTNASGHVKKKTLKDSYDWLYIYRSDGLEFLIQECLVGRTSITVKEGMRIGEQFVLKTNAP